MSEESNVEAEAPAAVGNISDLMNDTAEVVEDTEVEPEATPEVEPEADEDTPERPGWLPEKFKTPEAMSESYKHMEGKLGAFTGAPEEGYSEINPEDLGVDMEWFTEGDAGLNAFKGLASEMGVNQEGFSKIMSFYAKSEEARETNIFNNKMAAIEESFGGMKEAKEAFTKINARTSSVIGEEGSELLADALNGGNTSSVSMIKLINGILDAKQGKEFKQPTNSNSSNGMSESKLRGMMSDPRYRTDPTYQKEVEEAYAKFYN